MRTLEDYATDRSLTIFWPLQFLFHCCSRHQWSEVHSHWEPSLLILLSRLMNHFRCQIIRFNCSRTPLAFEFCGAFCSLLNYLLDNFKCITVRKLLFDENNNYTSINGSSPEKFAFFPSLAK